MSIEIKELAESGLAAFIDFPYTLFRDHPHWVGELKKDTLHLLGLGHPFWRHGERKLLMAYRDGRPAGRLAAIVNSAHNSFHGENCGFFGFFDCEDDKEAAAGLFAAAEKYLRAKGMDLIRGPVNPSTNETCGLLVEGFDSPPMIMMTYNPPYYSGLIEAAGFARAKDLLAFNMAVPAGLPARFEKLLKRINRVGNITVDFVQISKLDAAIADLKDIYNSAWEKNWGFIPMTEDEFAHTAKDLKTVIDPNLVLFVYVKNEPAGFIVGLPDYNQIFKTIPNGKLFPTGLFKLLTGKKKITRFRVLTMGVKEKFRNLGLASLMYVKAYENARKTYRECEMSWILESNFNMNRPLQLMGATPYKRYRIFEKVLRVH
ncbi:MAG TPA: N-acetyltransferase [Bdellovibrionales bacterium]|nr:N-acetyltransferase [Bdellovibrionales bacterium]